MKFHEVGDHNLDLARVAKVSRSFESYFAIVLVEVYVPINKLEVTTKGRSEGAE